MNDFPVLIAEHLKLDVSRMLQKPLGIDVGVAEGLLRLAARGLIGVQQFSLMAHNPHPASATAGHGFQNQRISDAFRFLAEFFFSFDRPVASWNRGESRCL